MPKAAIKNPLVFRKKVNDLLAEEERKSPPLVVVKPERTLGAVWMDEKVCARRAVVLCDVCVRKYGDWHKRHHYRGDWGWRYFGNCDGCSIYGCPVVLFLGEENFHQFLSPAHGRLPKP